MFRNEESGYRAASLIRDAIAATRFWFGEPPPLGMITFIDPAQVNPIRRRHTTPSGYVWEFDVWGYVWERVGFEYVGQTKEKGLLAFQLTPERMPEPTPPPYTMSKKPGGKTYPRQGLSNS